jgi:hypothetical protein
MNDWKKQLVMHIFNSRTRLEQGALKDKVKEWQELHYLEASYVIPGFTAKCFYHRALNRCLCPFRYAEEHMVLERAISFCRFRIWPLLEVTEYDVPQELRNDFAQVRPLIPAEISITIQLGI